MTEDPSVDALRTVAEQVGLPLTEDEAAQLLTAVRRDRDTVRELRKLVSPETEPAPIFRALPAIPGDESHG